MHKLSRHLHVDYETLSWASFFFESARVNEISVSGGSWFKKELDWKIYKLGVSEKDMKNLWDSNFDLYAEIVFADASKLKNFIEKEYPNIIGI